MRKKIGIVCMITGIIMITAAIGLLYFNQMEDNQAGNQAEEVMQKMNEVISLQNEENKQETNQKEKDESDTSEDVKVDSLEGVSSETIVEIDGYEYIGYLSVPTLGLDLPIMSEWSYPRLRIAPCRYHGAVSTDNLVIAGHNYSRHFGNLNKLKAGEKVIFTDVNGLRNVYEVVLTETLGPEEIAKMVNSEYELSLYTCTFGGANRVTVRCRLILQDNQSSLVEAVG